MGSGHRSGHRGRGHGGELPPSASERVLVLPGEEIPAQHYPRVIGELKGLGKLSDEQWLSDGSWSGILEIPAGVQTELYEKLNARTKGAAETALVK